MAVLSLDEIFSSGQQKPAMSLDDIFGASSKQVDMFPAGTDDFIRQDQQNWVQAPRIPHVTPRVMSEGLSRDLVSAYSNYTDKQLQNATEGYLEDAPKYKPKTKRTWGEAATDTIIDAATGVIATGESAMGIADLFTYNAAGKGWALLGYDPEKTKQILGEHYSEAYKDALGRVHDAKGFVNTLASLVDNPQVAFGSVVQSAPLTLSGAAVVREVAKKLLTKNGIKIGTEAAAKYLAKQSTKTKLLAAGALAEGAVTAGLIQEEGRQKGRSWLQTAPYAVLGGLGTAGISYFSSKIPGFRDVDVAAGTAGLGKGERTSLPRAALDFTKDTVKEGAFEEMPQEAQEQIFTNLALGKPWNEGVGGAAAQGMVVGGLQGGMMSAGSATINRMAARKKDDPVAGEQGQPDAVQDQYTPGPDGQPVQAMDEMELALYEAEQEFYGDDDTAGSTPQPAQPAGPLTNALSVIQQGLNPYQQLAGMQTMPQTLPQGAGVDENTQAAEQRKASREQLLADVRAWRDSVIEAGGPQAFELARVRRFSPDGSALIDEYLKANKPEEYARREALKQAGVAQRDAEYKAKQEADKVEAARLKENIFRGSQPVMADGLTPMVARDSQPVTDTVDAGTPPPSIDQPAADPTMQQQDTASVGDDTLSQSPTDAGIEGQQREKTEETTKTKKRSFLGDIRRMGGIKLQSLIEATDIEEVRGKTGKGNRYIAVTGKKGRVTQDLSEMADSMLSEGWPIRIDHDGGADVEHFVDLLKQAINENKPPVHPDNADAAAEAEYEAYQQALLEQYEEDQAAQAAQPEQQAETEEDSFPFDVSDLQAPPVLAYNAKRGNIELEFNERPLDKTIARLKEAGFKFNTKDKVWYAPDSQATADLAEELAGMDLERPEVKQPKVKAEEEGSKAKEFGMQPVEHYRVKQASGNAVSILPPVGKSFTEQDLNAIVQWARDAGWFAQITGKSVRAVAPDFSQGSWKGFPESNYVSEIQARKHKEQEEARKKKSAANEQETERLDATDAARFIEHLLGDSANNYNKQALAKFLLGEDKQYQGMFSHRMADTARNADATIPESDSAQELAQAIKGLYEQQGKIQQKRQEQSEAKGQPQAEPEATPPNKLDDFGEKLGGARKDQAPSLRMELTDQDIISQPLSKLWPLAEIQKIEDKPVAALTTVLREQIPAKPREARKLARWRDAVKMFRGLAKHGSEMGVDSLMAQMREYHTALSGVALKIELLQQLDRAEWGRIGKVESYPDSYVMEDGNRVSRPYSMVEVDGEERVYRTVDLAEITNVVNGLLNNEAAEKRMQFEVRWNNKDGFFINKKGDRDYTALKHFDSSKDAREFIKNNYDELVAAWEDVKDRQNVKKTDTRKAENRPRQGADHRQGKDVTPEMFQDAFGFRGVEFGNWVSQGKNAKERQGMINLAFDALHDLAAILNIPTQAISLNGSLGLAFGARGSGWAAAHYEPGNLVINLTKTKGAGSLAHEWFHALDNYFSRQRHGGEVRSEAGLNTKEDYRQGNYITYRPEAVYVPLPEVRKRYGLASSTALTKAELDRLHKKNRHQDVYFPENWMRDPNHKEGVRVEVEERFAELVNALNESPMSQRAAGLDKGKDGYWSRIIERGARAFENYVIHKMMQQGYHNDYLANVTPESEFVRDAERYPYLKADELAPVVEAFDDLFDTIQHKQTDKGVALYSKKAEVASKPVARSILDATVARVTAKWGEADRKAVVLLDRFDGLPAEVQEQAEQSGYDNNNPKDRVCGVAYKDKIYLIHENLHSEFDVEDALLHERLHRAVRSKGPSALITQMHNILVKMGGFKGLLELADKAGFDFKPYQEQAARLPVKQRAALYVEEFLAHAEGKRAYEKLPQKTLRAIREFWGGVRQWLQDSGYTTLAKHVGIRLGNFTQADLAFILRGIRNTTTEGSNTNDIRFMTAWHGTPHEFDRFSMEKIGTGEGAQAYGYGLYFAGNKEVAEWYREELARKAVGNDEQLRKLGEDLFDTLMKNDMLGFDTIREARQAIKDHQDWADRWEVSPEDAEKITKLMADYDARFQQLKKGRLYQVDLAPTEDEYLLWDKPLSEQSEKVRQALKKMPAKVIESSKRQEKYPKGRTLYYELVNAGLSAYANGQDASPYRHVHEKEVSEYLHSLGIRGIKYLDGSSRGKGEGNYNYVIFDDADVEITARFSLQSNPPANGGIRAGATEGVSLTREELAVYTKQLVRGKNVPGIIIKQRVSDLPFNAPGDAKGVFWRGNVYLVVNNIRDAQDARKVIAHEVIAHFGLRGFFGSELNTALDAIHRNNLIIRRYANDWTKNNADVIKAQKLTEEQVRYRAIEEAMARMAEAGKRFTFALRLTRTLQQLLRKAGLNRWADNIEAKTNAEAIQMLRKAELFIKHGLNKDSKVPDVLYPLFMTAWHGTPHEFDRFSTEKIGDGEGAQAYGYGLYFAGNREVAEWYRDRFTIPEATVDIDGKLYDSEEEPGNNSTIKDRVLYGLALSASADIKAGRLAEDLNTWAKGYLGGIYKRQTSAEARAVIREVLDSVYTSHVKSLSQSAMHLT